MLSQYFMSHPLASQCRTPQSAQKFYPTAKQFSKKLPQLTSGQIFPVTFQLRRQCNKADLFPDPWKRELYLGVSLETGMTTTGCSLYAWADTSKKLQ